MSFDPARPRLSRLASTTRRTALVDPIDVFAGSDAAQRALWLRPSSGEALVGLGCAVSLEQDFGAAWRELLADAAVDGAGGPVLMGGLRFDPRSPASKLWDGFSSSRLVVPERLVRVERGAAWLTVTHASGLSRAALPTEPPRLGLDPEPWRALVHEVASGIRTGDLGARKVVLARAEEVKVRVSVETALRRLAGEYPGCVIFAFAVGDACFMGATPERLVAVHDATATTMALAGSFPRGASPDEDARLAERLRHDPKERLEHALVVDSLREDLAPLCLRVVTEAEPRIHALANVQHLVTPIRAQLRRGSGVLDLVNRLHPTPAVGGYPRERALEVIREREDLDRGWYAAPLGWADAHGDGEFVVGLRSALVRGGTATLFAGCGIVGASDPDTEFAELGWKLRPMRTALGVGS